MPTNAAADATATATSPNLIATVNGSAPRRRFYVPDLATVAVISMQLALVVIVIHQFRLESVTFFRVMLLGSAGFVVHALLPLRYRLSFFAFLSLAAIIVAFGPRDGLSLIFLGMVLIGICHLPASMRSRVSLLLATAILFAVWRLEWLGAPWSVAIWPILASMFMFRLALYLYDLRYAERRPTPARTFAYFFMLPNVCFPLYPVIDYSTFTERYFDRDAHRIYETGMRWIVRGLLHLILYRVVYIHFAGDPATLLTLGDLVQFLLATFLLYLRVSGQFHLITGVLHLFGFRLPETHHLYYLASSFTDFWRRINIYWKGFMMKLVYYPCYFKLRRRGNKLALVCATISVFFVTWLLHSYQWFWLRGGFPLEAPDVLFWGLLCVLVVFGSLREMKRPQKRTLRGGPAWSASLGLRAVATFSALCVLWSLWSADSVAAWLAMWLVVGNAAPGDVWLLGGLLLGGFLVAGRPWSVRSTEGTTHLPFYRSPTVHSTALLVGIVLVGYPDLYASSSSQLASVVASLQRSTLNVRDLALQHKGYYEKLDNPSRMTAQLWEIQSQRPAHWVGLSATDAFRRRNDFPLGELRPGVHIVFMDQPFTTNRWGMRAHDYSLTKPRGTYRIAVLGPSHVMGSGVADGETFPDLLEERLNRSAGRTGGIRYEVLNFGIAGASMLEQLWLLEERALNFQPDAVFITDGPRGEAIAVGHLLHVVAARLPIPYPALDALVTETGVPALASDGFPVPFQPIRTLLATAGIETRMPWAEAERRLRFSGDSIVQWTFGRMADVIRRHGAVPVFVALDNVTDPPARTVRAPRHAEAQGLLVFNLFDLWEGRDKPTLRIAGWDNHPNATGNRVIADRLFELMQKHSAELRLRHDAGWRPTGPQKW